MYFKQQIENLEISDQVLQVYSPFNGQKIGQVDCLTSTGAEQALENAATLFKDKKEWLSREKRIEILNKTVQFMHESFDELVKIAAAEGGKPLVDTRVEMHRAIDGVKSCIECMRTDSGHTIPMNLNRASSNRVAFTSKEPRGVVLAFSAFNHPINLIVHQVGPAIATGCPVIIKPASDTPLSAFFFVNLLYKAGLPKKWCQVIAVETLNIATKMVTDSRVAFFSFIGSGKVGWMLRSKLADGTHCVLEHGGVAPVIVTADADLEDILPLLSRGAFYHAGQVCVSVQRIFAHSSIVEKVTDGLKQHALKIKVGDPLDENTQVGPIIRHKELQRVSSWVDEAVVEGATLVCGGERISESCYLPTILLNPDSKSKVSVQEIFGPVVCIYSYDDLDLAIAKANALPFAFQASVCTKNIDQAMYISRNLEAATVMINDHTAFRVDWMPFYGYKHSGYGKGGIPYSIEDMQIEKLTVIRSNF